MRMVWCLIPSGGAQSKLYVMHSADGTRWPPILSLHANTPFKIQSTKHCLHMRHTFAKNDGHKQVTCRSDAIKIAPMCYIQKQLSSIILLYKQAGGISRSLSFVCQTNWPLLNQYLLRRSSTLGISIPIGGAPSSTSEFSAGLAAGFSSIVVLIKTCKQGGQNQ